MAVLGKLMFAAAYKQSRTSPHHPFQKREDTQNVLCRCAEVFVAECLPFLLSLAKAEPAVVCPALEQAGAIPELFTSNLKLGPPASRQAASQLLILLYQQVHQLPCHKLLLSLSPATSTWGRPHPVRLPHSS